MNQSRTSKINEEIIPQVIIFVEGDIVCSIGSECSVAVFIRRPGQSTRVTSCGRPEETCEARVDECLEEGEKEKICFL